MKKILTVLIILTSLSLFADLPTTFDLRDVDGENFITSVKNQQGGTCWTHGTMASIESNLTMTNVWNDSGETGEANLAEYHLDWWNGYNQFFNEDLDPTSGNGLEVHMGGDYYVSTAYLSRGEGAVRDIDAQSYNSAPDRTNPAYHYFYPKDVDWFVIDSELNGIDAIKTRLMEKGAIAVCMCYDNAFMQTGYVHYQPESSDLLPNHSVTVVGWDDDKMVNNAPSNGAWLVKNSWGTGWGNSGYFWISYHDKHACKNYEMGAVSFYNVEPMQYTKVHYHDYHGARDVKTDVNEAFNAFTTESLESIEAVNFFTASNDVTANIKIYDDFIDGELSNELTDVSSDIQYRGFHTVELEESISLEADEDFYVYIEFSEGGHTFDRTSDVPVLLGASYRTIVNSSANPEESFYFEGGEWKDFYNFEFEDDSWNQTANFCIKALGNPSISENTPPENLQGEIINDNEILLSWEFASDNSRDFIGFTIYRNEEEHATLEGFNFEYLDTNLDNGSYSYTVTANYTDEETQPTNEISLDLELPSPTNLTHSLNDNHVVLYWDEPQEDSTVEEYNVYRNDSVIYTTSQTQFVDQNLEIGEYNYKISALYDGFESDPTDILTVNITSENDNIESITDLHSSFPNPYIKSKDTRSNGITIKYSIKEKSQVSIDIFNAKGQKVKTLVNNVENSGEHKAIWNGKDNNNNEVESGIYFYKMKNGLFGKTKKILLIK